MPIDTARQPDAAMQDLSLPIHIVGAGGHAKVVIDALLAAGVTRARLRVSDAGPAWEGRMLLDLAVTAPAVQATMRGNYFHVAIGDAVSRARLHAELLAVGALPLTVCHPRSVVSLYARLGAGVFVAAQAVVGPDASLGDGVIVNHGAVVDHDCGVGAFSHVAPNATLGGGTRVGAGVLIGAGVNILPGKQIGEGARLGAGAVVVHHVIAGATCVGVPAQSLLKESSD